MYANSLYTLGYARLVPRPPIAAFFAAVEKKTYVPFHGCEKSCKGRPGYEARDMQVQYAPHGHASACKQVQTQKLALRGSGWGGTGAVRCETGTGLITMHISAAGEATKSYWNIRHKREERWAVMLETHICFTQSRCPSPAAHIAYTEVTQTLLT